MGLRDVHGVRVGIAVDGGPSRRGGGGGGRRFSLQGQSTNSSAIIYECVVAEWLSWESESRYRCLGQIAAAGTGPLFCRCAQSQKETPLSGKAGNWSVCRTRRIPEQRPAADPAVEQADLADGRGRTRRV